MAPMPYQTEPQSKNTIRSLWKLEKIILDTLHFDDVVQIIVDSVLSELGYLNLGYRVIVLILHNKEKNILKRVSLSQTDEAKRLLATTTIPFPQMDIPLNATENICVKSFTTQSPQYTTYWPDILTPPFTPEEAIKYQQLVQIKSSMVFPVVVHGKSLGVLIFSLLKYREEVSADEEDLIRGFTDVVGIAVQNARLYSDLETTTKSLDEANKKLQELDKLKDEFVSLASHELRTPMTAIKGSLSTILDGYAGDVAPQAKEFLSAAYNENDRLIRLVNNLLNISRIEAGRFVFTFSQVHVDTLISDVVEKLVGAAKEKNLVLTYERNPSLPIVMLDEDKIREVLINLIGNAVKFTHTGGVTVGAQMKEGMVVFSVADTGSGIAKEDQDLLFKKFSQVRGNYAKQTGGTGLGLYISKQIIEGHKGKVWLESTLGKGSTFFFSLPIVQ